MPKNVQEERADCIHNIAEWFVCDTITLLDCVLEDGEEDPQFSANTVYRRLEEVVRFRNLYGEASYESVADYLLKNRYSREDVDLLERKRAAEPRINL